METTTTDSRLVVLFRHRAQAQRAVDALLDAGLTAAQITLTEPDHDLPRKLEEDAHTVHAPTTAETGMGTGVGALVGAAAGALTGWSRRRRTALSVALWSAFGSAVGAGAAALVAWIFGRDGAPRMELEPVHYDEGSLERGRAMVTVDAGAMNARAEEILLEFGGREPGKWRTARADNEADQPIPQNEIDNPATPDGPVDVAPDLTVTPTAEAMTIGRDRV
jgi:hypothetical protein